MAEEMGFLRCVEEKPKGIIRGGKEGNNLYTNNFADKLTKNRTKRYRHILTNEGRT
jgi:hypothetical protein